MLKVWVGKYMRFGRLGKPDTYFKSKFKQELTDTDFSRRLIYECSGGSEVIMPGIFKHPIRGNYMSEKLPTGVKTILLAKYDKRVVVDLLYCGNNCLTFLAEAANEEDIVVSTSRYVNFFPPIHQGVEFKGGVMAMNTGEIINDPIDWLVYYDKHRNDVIENEEGAVNPLDLL